MSTGKHHINFNRHLYEVIIAAIANLMSSELALGFCVLELVQVCLLGLSVTACVFFGARVCPSVLLCIYIYSMGSAEVMNVSAVSTRLGVRRPEL